MNSPHVRAVELEASLRWLIALRILVFLALLLAAILIQVATGEILDINPLYYLTAATFGISIVYIALHELLKRPNAEAVIQIGGDLLTITALTYLYRGIESPFSFLYLITIGTAATLFLRRGAYLTASGAAILYGTLVDLMALGILPIPVKPLGSDAEAVRQAWPPSQVYYSIFVNLFGFYAVAFVTSYLAGKLRATRAELSSRHDEVERLRAFSSEVVTSLSAGLLTVDAERRITFVNDAALRILGRVAGDWLGQPLAATHLADVDVFQAAFGEADRGQRANFVSTRVRLGGGEVSIAGTLSQLTDGSGQSVGHILLFDDITDRRELERRIRIKDRMAAVGEMAAGIAHEIRNPLASIAGSVQLLRSETGISSEGTKLSEIVLRESGRLNRIIEDFLRYARPAEARLARVDIAVHLAEALRLLRNSAEVGPAHEIRARIEPPHFEMVADADQIRQVFWNVATNGLRAMPEGGALFVEAHPEGVIYAISIRDTGRGMTEEEKARLFQPFKTRFDGGAGLGMAIVYRIVEDHSGRIVVESSPGAGTTIRVELPLRESSGKSG